MEERQHELIGVAEYAERYGVTVQAVYKRLKTSLKPFVYMVDGKKCIDITALSETQKNVKSTPPRSKVEDDATQRLTMELEAARQQIEELRSDKAFLQGQLSEVTKSLQFEQRKVDELQKLLQAPRGTAEPPAPQQREQEDVILHPENEIHTQGKIDAIQSNEEPKTLSGFLRWMRNHVN